MNEVERKLQRVRAMLGLHQLDAVLLSRSDNLAWLTGGAGVFVNTATDGGSAAILVTPADQFVLTNNIEATRLGAEERLEDFGFTLKISPWYEPESALAELARGLRLGADTPTAGAQDVAGALAGLRLVPDQAEAERFVALGKLCAAAMDAAIRQVRPGMTEYQIAGLLAQETLAREALPIVNLIATDERIYRFRHPLPTHRQMERYAMLILCGRQGGLVCSITRLVHFGPLPEDLRARQDACALVDAVFIHNTRPGRPLSAVFAAGVAAYTGAGYPDEWQLHHQGGPAGYQPREMVANLHATGQVVAAGQAYAWNPSIAGVKSEDTILVGEDGNTVLTEIPGWPAIRVELDNNVYLRPAILAL